VIRFKGGDVIDVGSNLITNYGERKYIVQSIIKGCICPHPLNYKNSTSASRVHFHCIVKDESLRKFYLSGYDEKTLISVWNTDDRLILQNNNKPTQLSFFWET